MKRLLVSMIVLVGCSTEVITPLPPIVEHPTARKLLVFLIFDPENISPEHDTVLKKPWAAKVYFGGGRFFIYNIRNEMVTSMVTGPAKQIAHAKEQGLPRFLFFNDETHEELGSEPVPTDYDDLIALLGSYTAKENKK